MKTTTKTKNNQAGENKASDIAKERPKHPPQHHTFEREQLISIRAFTLWESRGCTHGYDVDDWLAAESELINEELLMAQDSE
ncbi:DUF2934 domain-containing protein [Candidatus Obscuribacterales bacterium]|nr:DUF2934 domain-containing protein [Candidatus Obscuribacterales bacterium]